MSRKNMIKGILFLAIACMIFVAGQRKSNNIIQQNLKSNLIRFHVRANSNSRMDQTYKLKVRDAVIDQISPELSEAKTKEEAFKILKMQKNRIKNTAQEILKKEGVKRTFCTRKISREKLWPIYISRRYLRCSKNRSGGSKRAQLVVCHVPRSMRNKRWQGKDQQYSKKKDGETFREKNDQKNNKR